VSCSVADMNCNQYTRSMYSTVDCRRSSAPHSTHSRPTSLSPTGSPRTSTRRGGTLTWAYCGSPGDRTSPTLSHRDSHHYQSRSPSHCSSSRRSRAGKTTRPPSSGKQIDQKDNRAQSSRRLVTGVLAASVASQTASWVNEPTSFS